MEQKRSSFHWENPLARKMREDAQASLASEVVREFMEFYRLDYSLAVFGPEANLAGKTEDRSGLAKKVGLKTAPPKKPLLVHLIESFLSGGSSGAADKAPSPQKIDSLQVPDLGEMGAGYKGNNASTLQTKVDKAQSLLDDMHQEETHGFKMPTGSNQQQQQAKAKSQKSEKDLLAATDHYDDDFEYDIEEELPEEDDADAQASARQVETSGQAITVS